MINFKKMSNTLGMMMLSVYALYVFVPLERFQYASDISPIEEKTVLTFVEKDNNDNKASFVSPENKILKQDKLDVLLKLRDGHRVSFYEHAHNKNVQKYERQFRQAKTENELVKNLETRRHVDYIATQVEKRNLPAALALIPMVESNFKIHAKSHCGAVGLWQFMPRTGRALGLKSSARYDGRRDVKASTHAALNYLEYLHKRFNKDWMLALAAYNAGEGTVAKAIKRNRLQGKSTSFWALKLPRETMQYVPKILGLHQYIKQLK